MLYFTARKIIDAKTSVLALLLFTTNPLLLYFACTGELYAYDAAFSAFLVFLLLAAPRKWEFILFAIYGILGAFRISSFVLTFPVVFAVLIYRYSKTKETALFYGNLGAIVLGSVAWFVPFVIAIGGWGQLSTIIPIGLSTIPLAENLSTVLPFHFWMLNIGLILLAIEAKTIWRRIRILDERDCILVLLILVPAGFFFLKYYAKGYALLYLAPVAILLARLIMQSRRKRGWAIATIAANLAIFFLVPYQVPSVRSTLNHAHRSMAERWQSALFRSISYYAPTLAHLHASDSAMPLAKRFFDSIPNGSYVIVDGSSASLIPLRVLQYTYPNFTMLRSGATDSNDYEFYSNDSTGETFDFRRIASVPNVYYLTAIALSEETGMPPGNSIFRFGPLVLYWEPPASRDSLHEYLNALFFRQQE
jgi:hypothetical protein